MSRSSLLITAAGLLLCAPAFAQSYDKAVMLAEHGLNREAKQMLIDLVFDTGNQSADIQAKAYYLLGTIAAEEGHLVVANRRWVDLQKKFPDSEAANSPRSGSTS